MYRFRSKVDRVKVFTCIVKVCLRSYLILYPIMTLHVNALTDIPHLSVPPSLCLSNSLYISLSPQHSLFLCFPSQPYTERCYALHPHLGRDKVLKSQPWFCSHLCFSCWCVSVCAFVFTCVFEFVCVSVFVSVCVWAVCVWVCRCREAAVCCVSGVVHGDASAVRVLLLTCEELGTTQHCNTFTSQLTYATYLEAFEGSCSFAWIRKRGEATRMVSPGHNTVHTDFWLAVYSVFDGEKKNFSGWM